MERRVHDTPFDPAEAVSSLLTRLGLFLLVVLSPLVAMFSKRGAAILVPVATCLLILAASLNGGLPDALRRMGRSLFSRDTLALFVIMGWAGITTFWTTEPASAAGRLCGMLAIILVFITAIACLGGRVRASDVYLIPVGVSVAALALIIQLMPHSPLSIPTESSPDATERLRAAILLALLVWPATGTLMVRDRNWQALVLCLITLVALWLVHALVTFAAFIAGIIVMIMALGRPAMTARVLSIIILCLLFLAPVIGWFTGNYGGFLLPAEGDTIVARWRDVAYAIPAHFWGGYGFDSSASLIRGSDWLVLASPRNAALQIWLELGFIGVVLCAIAIVAAHRNLETMNDRSFAASLAAAASATVIMYAGHAAWQTWWLMFLGLTSVSLAFLARVGKKSDT